MRNVSVRCILICVVLSSLSCVRSDIELGFYDKSCPTAEKMIFDYVKQHVPNAPSLAAALLRMHFHDCFVRVSIHRICFFVFPFHCSDGSSFFLFSGLRCFCADKLHQKAPSREIGTAEPKPPWLRFPGQSEELGGS